jgi:hypothetical protein
MRDIEYEDRLLEAESMLRFVSAMLVAWDTETISMGKDELEAISLILYDVIERIRV